MAKGIKKELIGHDPLSWMDKKSEVEEVSAYLDRQDDCAIVLQEVVTIQTVSTLYSQLKSILEHNESIEIDASAVRTIDTSALQLFTLLKKTTLQMNKTLNIEFPSDQFVAAARSIGLAELLDVDQVASGLF